MLTPRVLVLFVLSFAGPTVLNAQGNAFALPASDSSVTILKRNLPLWMAEGGIPGLSVAIIRNGKTEWIGNFGVADKATARPVDDHTVFNAASLSKTVFAYAVLKLVDQGKLDLDAPLTRYVSKRVVTDNRLDKITARLVLSHRTGFPNWRPEGGELKILIAPGERFSYSGEGMVYLQTVVETIEGKPLNDIIHALVFAPLGMTQSAFVWQPDWAGHAVTGYTSSDTAVPLTTSTGAARANAAASLSTTAHDYARFLEAVLTGRGLTPATLRAMETAQVAVDPECTNCTDRIPKTLSTDLFWGLGWGIEQNASDTYLWHWGDNGVFKAYVVADVKRRSAVVMFDNSETGLSVAKAIVLTALGGEHPSFTWLHYDTYDSGNMRFTRAAATHGVVEAMKEFASAIANGTISESTMNSAGYSLLREKRYADAISVFRSVVELHPASANAFDSLGEAYMNAGDTTLAIRNYSKALELDPGSSNAKVMLAKLRSGSTPP